VAPDFHPHQDLKVLMMAALLLRVEMMRAAVVAGLSWR
jgi:hypothetical protein